MNKLLLISMTVGLMASACTDATDDGEYLFGLNTDEILELRDAYQPGTDDETALARLQSPFDCGNYGDMCRFYGEDFSYELVELEIEMALSGASVDDIDAMIDARTKDVDPTGSDRVWSTQTQTLNITSTKRVRATYGTVYPLVGKARSKCYAKYQQKSAGVWWAKKADMLKCLTASHREWSITFGWGTPSTGTDHYASWWVRKYNETSVTAKHKYDRPSGGWGYSTQGLIDSYYTIVQTRAFVEVEPKGWSTTLSWELI